MSKKRDIRNHKFRSIASWRGDSLCCPQAFGGDIFAGCSMGCWWCFCRELEEQLYNKYYDGWSRDLVRPCDPEDYRQLFDKAFGSDREYKDWTIKCLRYGLPFNMGSKAETFNVEDLHYESSVVIPVLELFREYNVPVIFETKSQFIGLERYMDIIKDLNCAVIISVMGGTDTLNYKLEPGAPTASARWAMVEQLRKRGIWTAVRWEPIMPGINSQTDLLKDYAEQAAKSGAKHVSFFNYRTSGARIAQREFESRGYNYTRMLEKNLDENWQPIGKKLKQFLREQGIPSSSPDFVNFPFDNDCESCCGVDGLFVPYRFTFQYACKCIESKGSVSWSDMEEIEFREPNAYETMKANWNGGDVYSLADSPEVVVLDKDSDGMNIYGKREDNPDNKQGFFF